MYVQYGGGVEINLLIRNSIFSHGPGVVYVGPDVNLTADHNLFYRPGEDVPLEVGGRQYTNAEIEAGAVGTGNLARDPLFINPHSPDPLDYQLQDNSPAIGAGTSQGAPTEDLLHRPRLQPSDMGAYEHAEDTQPPVITATDPANGSLRVPVAKGMTIATTKSISGSKLAIKPKAKLAYNAKYTVTLPAKAVKDKAGNSLAKAYSFKFTTVPNNITNLSP